jgi:hypothetical protein
MTPRKARGLLVKLKRCAFFNNENGFEDLSKHNTNNITECL